VVQAMAAAGIEAKPYLAMSYWHPFPAETAAAMQADGITRALLLPLYPHRSRTTSGSAFRTIESALADKAIATTRIEGYATAPGYIEALCDRIGEASGPLPEPERSTAPVLFSAHGLPEAYIRRGDLYLDDVRATVTAVTRRLGLESRAQLAFLAEAGHHAGCLAQCRWMSWRNGVLGNISHKGFPFCFFKGKFPPNCLTGY